MPYRITSYIKDQPFHILSRAVDGKEIFKDEIECHRFIFQLYAANIGKPALNIWKKDIIKISQALLRGENLSSRFISTEHEPLVSILDFSLNINHYHIYLLPNLENSVPLYMKKLNGGFAKYFNLKHNRNGSLFGSRYKSIEVKTDYQSNAVSRYVNVVNPLDVFQPGWRENGLKDWDKAFEFLETYPFSSFPDRIGKRNSKILASKDILERYFSQTDNGRNEYIEFIKDFLKQKLNSLQFSFLEV